MGGKRFGSCIKRVLLLFLLPCGCSGMCVVGTRGYHESLKRKTRRPGDPDTLGVAVGWAAVVGRRFNLGLGFRADKFVLAGHSSDHQHLAS